jgi:hypothetical protein
MYLTSWDPKIFLIYHLIKFLSCAGNIQEVRLKLAKDIGMFFLKLLNLLHRSISRAEIGNLLENFKTELLGTLSSQFDAFKLRKDRRKKMQPYLFFVLNVEKNIQNENVH